MMLEETADNEEHQSIENRHGKSETAPCHYLLKLTTFQLELQVCSDVASEVFVGELNLLGFLE